MTNLSDAIQLIEEADEGYADLERACQAWFRARNCTNRNEVELQNTETDLLDLLRHWTFPQ
jgi:hypothetical protein